MRVCAARLVAICFAVLVSGACTASRFTTTTPSHPSRQIHALAAGDIFPRFQATSLNGEPNEPSRNVVNVVSVISSACVVCASDLAPLHWLSQEIPGVELLYVDSSESRQQAVATQHALRAEPGQVLLDSEGSITRILGVVRLPTTFIVDEGGRVGEVIHGPISRDRLMRFFSSTSGPGLGIPTCAPNDQPWASSACPESVWARRVIRTAGGAIGGIGDGIEPQPGDAFVLSLDGYRMQLSAISGTDMSKMGGWFSMGEFGAGMPSAGKIEGVGLYGSSATGHWSWMTRGFTVEVSAVSGPAVPPRSIVAKLVTASVAPVT